MSEPSTTASPTPIRRRLLAGLWDAPATRCGTAFRVLGAGLLGVYLARHALSTWPLLQGEVLRTPHPPLLLCLLWVLGCVGCVTCAAGLAPRLSSLAILAVVGFASPAISPVATLEDFAAAWLAAWLSLMPSPFQGRGAKRQRLSRLPGMTPRLLMLGSAMLYGRADLWQLNLPDFAFGKLETTGLVAACILGLHRGTRLLGLGLLLGVHGLLASDGRLHWAHGLVACQAALYLDGSWPVPRHWRSLDVSMPRVRFDAGTGLGLTLIVLWGAVHYGGPLPQGATGGARRLLARLALLPPRAPGPGNQELRQLQWQLSDAQGRALRQALPGPLDQAGARRTVLLSYLTPQPWRMADRAGLNTRLRHWLAAQICSERTGNYTLRVSHRAAGEPAILGVGCGASGPQVLSTTLDRSPLPTAQDPDFKAPARVPAQPARDAYAGSQRCRQCHAQAYGSWLRSPHARGLIERGQTKPLGRFDGRTAGSAQGRVRLLSEGGEHFMEIRGHGAPTRHRVDFMLGAGDQLQAYLTQTPTGALVLPLIWSQHKGDWAPVAELYPALYGPSPPPWTQSLTLTQARCALCHTTAPYTDTREQSRLNWLEPRVGCEACHGPAAAHASRQRAALEDASPAAAQADPYVSLQRDGRHPHGRCIACHGPADEHTRFQLHGERPSAEHYGGSLEHAALLANGTPRVPEYQWPAFGLSACARVGGATCSSCHDSHSGAVPTDADRMCVGCHRELQGEAASQHSRHPGPVTCVDCHMPRVEPPGDAGLFASTRHDLTVPRPAEDALLGLPSACEACHRPVPTARAHERWTEQVRPWVAELHALKQTSFQSRHPLSTDAIGPTLTADHPTRLLGVLRLLARCRPDNALVDRLQPLARHHDPAIRAAALLALERHAEANTLALLRRGLQDEAPSVRMTVLARLLDLQRMTDAEQRSYLHGLLEHASVSPARELERLSDLRRRAGDAHEALALLQLAARYSTAAERRALEAKTQGLEDNLK